MKSSGLPQALSWIVTLLVVVAIVLTSVRAMFTPLYLRFEYNAPGFPQDYYGFTTQDRLYWSQYALDYLLNDAGISYLGDLQFGDGSPVFNERELSHMIDVKNVSKAAFLVWYISLAGLVLLGLWAWRGEWWEAYRAGMVRGGWLTILLLATILVLVLISFGVLFVAFHNVFFQPGTWMFEYSDTLIRLFPERFWRDIFILVGLISVILGLVTILVFRGKSSPKKV